MTGLVAPGTVDTLPGTTLEATIDHAEVTGDTIRGTHVAAQAILDGLEGLGIAYADVVDIVEAEGVEKFEKSWAELLGTVTAELERVRD